MSMKAEFDSSDSHVRPHCAVGYVTPADMLAGQHREIQQTRDRKLALRGHNHAEG
jgi:tRNA G37 N-methylase TrmD